MYKRQPAHLIHTARFIAASRGMELDELARATTQNAETFYTVSYTHLDVYKRQLHGVVGQNQVRRGVGNG